MLEISRKNADFNAFHDFDYVTIIILVQKIEKIKFPLELHKKNYPN